MSSQEIPPQSQQLYLLTATRNTRSKISFHIANVEEKHNILSSGRDTLIMKTRGKARKTFRTPKNSFKNTTLPDEIPPRGERCGVPSPFFAFPTFDNIFSFSIIVIYHLCVGTSVRTTGKFGVGNCVDLELESSGCDRGLYRLVGSSDDLYRNLGFLGMICYSRVTRIFGSLWKDL